MGGQSDGTAGNDHHEDDDHDYEDDDHDHEDDDEGGDDGDCDDNC